MSSSQNKRTWGGGGAGEVELLSSETNKGEQGGGVPNLGMFSERTFCMSPNSNMENSMVMFTFPVFHWKHLFGQILSKISKLNCQFEVKFCTRLT